MQGQGAKAWTDRWLAELAEAQHGVVARPQLLAAGMTKGEIDSRLALGRLHIVQRGVYAVGRPSLDAKGNWLAAVLSLGGSTVLSHSAAAALWGFRPIPAGAIHVTALTDSGRKKRLDVTIHRARDVETTTHDGIPVTTPARTLLDLAATLPARPLERAIERAVELRLFDLREIHAVVRPGRRGGRALLEAVEAYDDAPARGVTPALAGGRVARFSAGQVAREAGVVAEVVGAHLRRSAA